MAFFFFLIGVRVCFSVLVLHLRMRKIAFGVQVRKASSPTEIWKIRVFLAASARVTGILHGSFSRCDEATESKPNYSKPSVSQPT